MTDRSRKRPRSRSAQCTAGQSQRRALRQHVKKNARCGCSQSAARPELPGSLLDRDPSDAEHPQTRHHQRTTTEPAKKKIQRAATAIWVSSNNLHTTPAHQDSCQSPCQRYQDRLEQKLLHAITPGGAHRTTDANLPAPLGDGNRHQAHDHDAADQQRHHGDSRQDPAQRAAGAPSFPSSPLSISLDCRFEVGDLSAGVPNKTGMGKKTKG